MLLISKKSIFFKIEHYKRAGKMYRKETQSKTSLLSSEKTNYSE